MAELIFGHFIRVALFANDICIVSNVLLAAILINSKLRSMSTISGWNINRNEEYNKYIVFVCFENWLRFSGKCRGGCSFTCNSYVLSNLVVIDSWKFSASFSF